MFMENNKLYSILAYICPLWIIGLISAKDDADVKFHVNQGIVLSIGWVISWILAWVFIGYLLMIPLAIFAIMGIISANKGEQKELPLIGKIKIIK
jgi:uncharacterized membrane protein